MTSQTNPPTITTRQSIEKLTEGENLTFTASCLVNCALSTYSLIYTHACKCTSHATLQSNIKSQITINIPSITPLSITHQAIKIRLRKFDKLKKGKVN